VPSIRIERAHRFGLKRARAVAQRWADEAERSHGLRCTLRETPDGDTYEFARSGVQGRCVADAKRFLLEAELGWTLALMRGRIEREIEAQLDAAIAAETAKDKSRRASATDAAQPAAGKAAGKARPGKGRSAGKTAAAAKRRPRRRATRD